jgi:hypothetical protein
MHSNKKWVGSTRIKLTGVVTFLAGLFFIACQQDPGEYTLGQKYIESQTDLALIDTFTVSFPLSF